MSNRKTTLKSSQTMTKTEYARHRGVTLQAVRRALADGRAVADADGQVLVIATDRKWLRNRIAVQPAASGASQHESLAASAETAHSTVFDGSSDGNLITSKTAAATFIVSKARRERAAAATAELVLAETQRRLVDRSAVEREVGAMLIGVRSRLLAMSSRIAATLAAETNPARVRLRLLDELAGALDVTVDTSSET